MESQPKTLVVDASVGCAAINEKSVDPTAICCIDLLDAIFEYRYNIAMSEEIENEWEILRSHDTAYANKWLVRMEKRERVTVLQDVIDDDLRNCISGSTHNASTIAAMLKDVHLLEAALATDKTIISRDKKCRRYFKEAASSVLRIAEIAWANPELPEDNAVAWLQHGAPNEKERQLGYSKK